MSVVVAIKKNNKIYLGADTQTSNGDRKRNYLGENDRKIHLFDNGILLGVTGTKWSRELLAADPDIFRLSKSDDLDKRHIVENIVPKIEACFSENDLLEKPENEPPQWPCSLVLAYKDKLFLITNTGEVLGIEHYVAIGSGQQLAYVELEWLDREESSSEDAIRDRLANGLRICAKYRRSVGGPFFLIDSEAKEYKLVE